MQPMHIRNWFQATPASTNIAPGFDCLKRLTIMQSGVTICHNTDIMMLHTRMLWQLTGIMFICLFNNAPQPCRCQQKNWPGGCGNKFAPIYDTILAFTQRDHINCCKSCSLFLMDKTASEVYMYSMCMLQINKSHTQYINKLFSTIICFHKLLHGC
jgi:hypothetical protein